MSGQPLQKKGRLLSLDVFRGMTIAGMILVNNPGTWSDIYPPLRHAQWHGCTPTDLIFPFFLFIVGVAITLSLTKRKERGDDQSALIKNIIRRSAVLFGLGLILASFPFVKVWDQGFGAAIASIGDTFANIRIPGVLQRIALVYLITAILFLKMSIKNMAWLGGGLLVFYWLIMTLIPVPGVGYANLEPTTNLAAWFDNMILSGHMWSATKVWDPEGLLSTMPAIGTAILGILAGDWIRREHDPKTKALWMFFAANILLLAGYLWDGFFPLNKSLWTSSYVLYTGGLALHFLTMCYWIIDVLGYKKWAKPFEVYGMNAITVFFLSGIIGRLLYIIKIPQDGGTSITLKNLLYESIFLPIFDPINASLAWALTYIIIWLGFMWILYSKKIFIKV